MRPANLLPRALPPLVLLILSSFLGFANAAPSETGRTAPDQSVPSPPKTPPTPPALGGAPPATPSPPPASPQSSSCTKNDENTARDGQLLCAVPRRVAKEYYREAYDKFAGLFAKDDRGLYKNQEVDTHGRRRWSDPPANTVPELLTDRDATLQSGWPTSPDIMPVFLTEDEATVAPSWQDYNRLNGSATFLPAGDGVVRSFLLIQSKLFRTNYFSYTPATDDQRYDLTKPPIRRRLTRAQEEKYWAELPTSKIWKDTKRLSVALGISPNGFQLGKTTTESIDATKAAYLLGLSYSLNPYASVHVGETTIDGRHFRPGLGLGLDVDIISKIFGGAK